MADDVWGEGVHRSYLYGKRTVCVGEVLIAAFVHQQVPVQALSVPRPASHAPCRHRRPPGALISSVLRRSSSVIHPILSPPSPRHSTLNRDHPTASLIRVRVLTPPLLCRPPQRNPPPTFSRHPHLRPHEAQRRRRSSSQNSYPPPLAITHVVAIPPCRPLSPSNSLFPPSASSSPSFFFFRSSGSRHHITTNSSQRFVLYTFGSLQMCTIVTHAHISVPPPLPR